MSRPPAGENFAAAGPLRVYNYYRLVISIALLLAFLNDPTRALLGAEAPTLFVVTIVAYVAVNLLLAVATFIVPPLLDRIGQAALFTLVAFDVLSLTVLMHSSGGVASGLAPLTLVAIGAGAILLDGRVMLVLPAVASLAVLYSEVLRTLGAGMRNGEYFQAGILGALYFATAIVLRRLAARLRHSEHESLQRAREVQNLEQLSDAVIQRMRTGILVVNREGRIRMANSAARQLVRNQGARSDQDLPPPLLERLAAWRADAQARGQPFQVESAGPDLRANFSAIRPDEDADTIVFLEDQSEVQQQAQQLKLAGLGRLSASIAHEIRNPLGAISHAAQLLAESPDLVAPDQRLAEIIQAHCRRVNTIIANVLELSRRRQPSLERIALPEWLARFIAEYQESHPSHPRIDVNASGDDVSVQFDPSHLQQVLTNLVDNALRYASGADGAVRLTAGIDDISERPYLQVVDDGPGIAPDRITQLFEPFFTTEAKGTGLGLYISRELCEANQARLSYVPAVPRGSCFRIAFAHPKRVMG